jgi:hypothetical protein
MSLSGSVLILLLILLNPLLRERFSKTWQYYIWLIVLLRLVLPYSPEFGLLNTLFDLSRPAPATVYTHANYVFALPPRYNYFAFLTGFEDVEKILAGNPRGLPHLKINKRPRL